MGNWLKNLRFWLFVATFISCAFAVTFYSGNFDIYNPLSISYGLPFALAIMFILLCHESGHYFTARWWGMTKVTGPMFIPMPISPFGTFGAVIKLDSAEIPNRRALFDIGAAGPWAGILATAAVAYFRQSFEADARISGQMMSAVFLGIILTWINLFPIGQLDGGHILYTLDKKNYFALEIFNIIFLAIYLAFFQVILTPLTLIFFIFIAGLRHSPTKDDDTPLGTARKYVSFLTILLFLAIMLLISAVSLVSFQNAIQKF